MKMSLHDDGEHSVEDMLVDRNDSDGSMDSDDSISGVCMPVQLHV